MLPAMRAGLLTSQVASFIAGARVIKLSRRRWIVIALAAVVVAILALQAFRGEKLPGYRLTVQPLTQSVVATGRVLSVSRVQVGAEITGVVVERRVEEGDVVAPGDVLVVLRADDLAAQVRAAEAQLAQLERSRRPQALVAQREAEAQLAQTQREAARRRDLFERNLIARESLEQAEEAEVIARAAEQTARLTAAAAASGGPDEVVLQEQLAAARAALEKTIVRSEVAGVVLTRNAEPGDLVQPSRVLFDIARAGDTEILVPFDEKNLSLLRKGQRAVCIADAFPDETFFAEIVLIAPRVDPERGTVDVRLRVDPVPEFLRQDMTVSASVETGRREQALVVPNDALVDASGASAYVIAVRDGRTQRVPVRLGLRGLTLTEVVEGLSAGDLVLRHDGKEMEDGTRVRVIEEALPAAPERDERDDAAELRE